jgi:very-short-patch-repair endonuclease
VRGASGAAKSEIVRAPVAPAHVVPQDAVKGEGTVGAALGFHVLAPGRVTASLAGTQQGNVTRGELLDAGVSRHVIQRRLQAGELHRVHQGVYLAGHTALAPRALEAAALLACGERAVISHRSAAYLWSLIPARPDEVDVTIVGSNRRRRKGIRLHFAARLDAQDLRAIDNLRVTAPARTIIDFAAEAEDDELEAAISEARALKRITHGELERALERAGPRKGVGRVRALLRAECDTGYTRSRAERLMRRLLRAAGLRQPLTNRPLLGYNVDFLWPEQRLVVEVDGYQFHGHRDAFERDRKKDQVLTAAGYTVIRITWRQLTEEPIRVIAAIASALSLNSRA